jgi:DegV family protein with EDD domain
MKKVAVMTDTGSNIPQQLAQNSNIRMMPFHIIIDGRDYLDTEIDMGDLYARLSKKENLPTTSFPSVEEYLQAYQELSQRAEAILFISVTSIFTKAYNLALQAKEIALKKLPKTAIEVIDSRTGGTGLALIVLQAARLAEQGKDIKAIMEQVNHMIPRINHLSAPDTLFYLDKGGRICEAKSWAEAQSVNSFRALVEIDASTGGVTKPIARAKTKRQIMERMVSIAKERVGDKKMHAGITHNNIPEQAEQLRKMVTSQFQCDELYLFEALAPAAVRTGQGLVDLGFYSSE